MRIESAGGRAISENGELTDGRIFSTALAQLVLYSIFFSFSVITFFLPSSASSSRFRAFFCVCTLRIEAALDSTPTRTHTVVTSVAFVV